MKSVKPCSLIDSVALAKVQLFYDMCKSYFGITQNYIVARVRQRSPRRTPVRQAIFCLALGSRRIRMP